MNGEFCGVVAGSTYCTSWIDVMPTATSYQPAGASPGFSEMLPLPSSATAVASSMPRAPIVRTHTSVPSVSRSATTTSRWRGASTGRGAQGASWRAALFGALAVGFTLHAVRQGTFEKLLR